MNIEHPTSNIEHRIEARCGRASGAYIAAILLIAAAAFTVALLATRWGIATSSDSARYIRSARHVLGREVRVETEVSAEARAEQAHYPPMYSTVLAVASLGGADPLVAARWLHALLLAANAVIAAELVRRFTGSQAAALFTGVVSAFSHASVYIHTIALSEPLYVTLSLLSVGLLASHLRRTSWSMLVGSALLCGGGVLTRYAGWALVPAGGVCLLLLSRRALPRRLLDAIVFGVVACVLPIGWSIRNQLVLGSATNRVIAWHPVGLLHLRDGARTAWNWLAAEAVVHPVLTGLAALVAATILVLPLLLNRGANAETAWDRRTLPVVMIVFSLAFAALLTASISLFDYHTPVDRRILSPVYAAWVIVAGCVLADVGRSRPVTPLADAGSQPQSRSSQPIEATRVLDYERPVRWRPRLQDLRRPAAWTIALILAVWSIGRGARLGHEQFRDGSGFAHRHWRESQTLAALRANVSHEQAVYTNAPGAMYLLTNRPFIIALPSKFSASSMRANPKYGGQLRRMRDDVQSGRAVIVYLHRYARGRQRYNPTEQEVTELGFVPLARGNDGAIYRAAPARAPSQQSDAAGAESLKQ